MIEAVLVEVAIEIVMKGLVDKVDAQVQYVLGFEHEFDEMKSELLILRSYLADVDRHRETYSTLEAASAKLRELIYRIDDLVIDCQNRVDYERMKNRWLRAISLRGMYFRIQIGKKLVEINRDIVRMRQTLNIIPPMISRCKSEEFGDSGSGSDSGRVRWTSDSIDESQTVGLAEDARRLKRWILPSNRPLQLIGIVGMGGLGKTTLAQKIYNDKQVCSHFDIRIWVCKSTIGEVEILRNILQQLRNILQEALLNNVSDINVLERLQEFFSNERLPEAFFSNVSNINAFREERLNSVSNSYVFREERLNNVSNINVFREERLNNVSNMNGRFQGTLLNNVSDKVLLGRIEGALLNNVSDRNVLLGTIQEALLNKKYLIVMDDVWSIDDGWWKRIHERLRKTEKQSCIIVTSRNEDVVKGMEVEEEQIHRPKLLSDEEGWALFCKVAFRSSKGKCENTELEHVGKAILKKCSGLPLAIKTIGGLLSKSQSRGAWQEVFKNLSQIFVNECKGHDSLMATLRLSYNELPLQQKQCILCFAIYPEDCEIEVDQLANWWIGEGFIYKKGAKIARKLALECLSELVSRCLVEAVRKRNYDGRVYTCKMHDMIRDMIIQVAKEEKFCSLDENNANIATIHSRRLGVAEGTLLQPLAGNSKLRALLLTKAKSIGFTRHAIGFTRHVALAHVKSLRVLDLSHIKFEESSEFCEEDMWRWVTSLKRLAYLSFRDVAKLTKLPRSIKKLWGLQILVLDECKDLKQLPRSIALLPKLIVLDVRNCISLSHLPQGLSKLSHLQELYGFKIPDATIPNACHLRDLKDLSELRVLHLDVMEGSMIEEDELTVLEQFQHLRMLSVDAGNREDGVFLERLEKLSPPICLEELYLRHFCGHTTPAWIAPESLDQLLYLCIEDSKMLERMSDRFKGSAGNKWKIEGLCLKYLPKLEERWEDIKGAMPCLQYGEVSYCNSLESFDCAVKNIGIWRKPEDENEEPKEEHHNQEEMN